MGERARIPNDVIQFIIIDSLAMCILCECQMVLENWLRLATKLSPACRFLVEYMGGVYWIKVPQFFLKLVCKFTCSELTGVPNSR